MCTDPNCDSPLFEDRNTWFQHELEQHRRQWECQYCTAATFNSSARMESHIHEKHPQLPPDMLPPFIKACSRPLEAIEASACPLCHVWEEKLQQRAGHSDQDRNGAIGTTLHEFRRHLGQHLEQLALFAIPIDTLGHELRSGSNEARDDLSSRGFEVKDSSFPTPRIR